MCNISQEKVPNKSITRREAIKKIFIMSGGLFLSLFVPSRKAQAGWHRCGVSGCPCQYFQLTDGSDHCANCGHIWAQHW
jgi:hypothetical protein